MILEKLKTKGENHFGNSRSPPRGQWFLKDTEGLTKKGGTSENKKNSSSSRINSFLGKLVSKVWVGLTSGSRGAERRVGDDGQSFLNPSN